MREIGSSGIMACGDSVKDTSFEDKIVADKYKEIATAYSNPIASFFMDVFS